MQILDIRLFGTFEAQLGQETLQFPTRKTQALLAYLAFEAESPQSRAKLASILWPDREESAARQSLRQTLFYLRRLLPNGCLQTTRNTVCLLLREDVSTDVLRFRHEVQIVHAHEHESLKHCPTCVARLQRAVSLYRGDLLEHLFLQDSNAFEEWALLNREWLRRQALNALSTIAEYHLAGASYDQAHHYAWWQISIDPLREEAHEQLIRVLALNGRRSEALAQYDVCKRLLAQELQIAPATKITELYVQLKATEDTSIVLAQKQFSNPHLPIHFTTFIGRDSELAQIEAHLENPHCHLLTLCGPGGIGKTQLALHAAQRYRQAGEQRSVCYVPLSGLKSPELLSRAILEVLGITVASERLPRALLLEHLSSRNMLLILDSFEHLLAGAFRSSSPEPHNRQTLALLNDILVYAPGVKLMVTSRELLNLRAEWILEIGGLPYVTTGDNSCTVARLTRYDAILLFQQSARQVKPSFAISRDTAASVVQICRLTEGMPLAIQLAGSLVRHFSCDEILQALQKDVAFLSSSLRDIPARHRSIRAVFEQSWETLSQIEQLALQRIAKLPIEFDATAATATTGVSHSTLYTLADKSLLHALPKGRFRQYSLFRKCLVALE